MSEVFLTNDDRMKKKMLMSECVVNIKRLEVKQNGKRRIRHYRYRKVAKVNGQYQREREYARVYAQINKQTT